eukprot:gnl/TRDRNA2_/TRDRNA2_45375_c0_seq1.p1 gnl/TRDRNA2_/TRDRNA2_45375_c0~~gnl/TRDRNA2_/TRDRNA2_45375_c0_seq1.p1  ORF type:complete len:261 (-),score=44.00 gnl/TRDRNA2_/TRDRNA2_45375_c0_seq1:10-792(-)
MHRQSELKSVATQTDGEAEQPRSGLQQAEMKAKVAMASADIEFQSGERARKKLAEVTQQLAQSEAVRVQMEAEWSERLAKSEALCVRLEAEVQDLRAQLADAAEIRESLQDLRLRGKSSRQLRSSRVQEPSLQPRVEHTRLHERVSSSNQEAPLQSSVEHTVPQSRVSRSSSQEVLVGVEALPKKPSAASIGRCGAFAQRIRLKADLPDTQPEVVHESWLSNNVPQEWDENVIPYADSPCIIPYPDSSGSPYAEEELSSI